MRYDQDDDNGMDVFNASAEDFFNSNYSFRAPHFQRSYVWKEDQWDRFLDDMLKITDEDKGYFMGFLVLKKESERRMVNYNLVIDGQQRLTTFLIFAKVMCEFKSTNKRKIKFINRNGGIVFEHNHIDKHVFELILKGDSITEKIEELYEDNQVLECYKYFKDEKQEKTIEKIKFDKVFKRLFFVCMFLDDNDDAQQIFDTMNSLGMPLSTSELLKNELFHRDQIVLYEKTWKKTFEKDNKTRSYWNKNTAKGRAHRSHIDLLLQSVLYIKEAEHKVSQKSGESFQRYKYILDNHYKNNKKEFIDELMEYAKKYKDHIKPDAVNKPLDDSYITQRLNLIIFGLEMTTVIPYIIFILKEVEDEEEQKKMFNLIETFLMRRVMVGETTKRYNLFFMELMRHKKEFTKVASYERLEHDLYRSKDATSGMPDDKKLDQTIENGPFTGKMAIPKLILYLLEIHTRSKKSTTALHPFKKYQVEHIMPKKWKTHWQNNLPKGKNAATQEKYDGRRNNMILTLGNLTLLTSSLNASIKHSSWKDKRDGKGGEKKLKGFKEYCKDIATFSNYLKEKDWNEKIIKKRSQELLKTAKNLWPYGR